MTPIETAARTAWGEARGEGVSGMQAVLNVIGNRVKSPGWWGRDIAGVCLNPWQFSCWNKNDPNRDKLLSVTDEDPRYRAALSLAAKLAAGTLHDITRGSDSYFSRSIPDPGWAKDRKPRAVIGNHAFYRIGLTGTG